MSKILFVFIAVLVKDSYSRNLRDTTETATVIDKTCSLLTLDECFTPPNCHRCQIRKSMFTIIWPRSCIKKAQQTIQTKYDYMALAGLLTFLFLLFVLIVSCKKKVRKQLIDTECNENHTKKQIQNKIQTQHSTV